MNACFALPTLDSQLYLSECLESIHSTDDSSSAKIPIIILDGGSKDATLAIASDYQKKYGRVVINRVPHLHPAERLNKLIDSKEYAYIMLCHSDDIYNAKTRFEVLNEMRQLGHYMRGSQVSYFHTTMGFCNAMESFQLLAGSHIEYPRVPQEIFAEMPFWWCFSNNAITLNALEISRLGINFDWKTYKFCSDYNFSWQLTKLSKCSNSDKISVLTRVSNASDGSQNKRLVDSEVQSIRLQILKELGFSAFLSQSDFDLMISINYSYGEYKPSADTKAYARADERAYRQLHRKVLLFCHSKRICTSYFDRIFWRISYKYSIRFKVKVFLKQNLLLLLKSCNLYRFFCLGS